MIKPIHLREADFKRDVEAYKFPKSIKDAFFEYWSEPNKSNSKMRFEMEKTWHLSRRLARWANNNFGKGGPDKPEIKPKVIMKDPVTEIEKLDALLAQYEAKHESIPFDSFADWYEYLKANKLLRQFTREEVERISAAYPDDKRKCRAACVQMTFMGYINTGLTFGHIMEMRNRLHA